MTCISSNNTTANEARDTLALTHRNHRINFRTIICHLGLSKNQTAL